MGTLTKHEIREKRREEKKIRVTILDLQDRHCENCTKVIRDHRGNSNKFCMKECDIGIRIKELGDKLKNDDEDKGGRPSNGSPNGTPAEVIEPMECTRENYEILRKKKIPEKQIPQYLGITYPELYKMRQDWGFVKRPLGRPKKEVKPEPAEILTEDDLFPEEPAEEMSPVVQEVEPEPERPKLSRQKWSNAPAAEQQPPEEKKKPVSRMGHFFIHLQQHEALLEKYEDLAERYAELQADHEAIVNDLDQKLKDSEKKYFDIFSQMQLQDREIARMDKLISSFREMAHEAQAAIDYANVLKEKGRTSLVHRMNVLETLVTELVEKGLPVCSCQTKS